MNHRMRTLCWTEWYVGCGQHETKAVDTGKYGLSFAKNNMWAVDRVICRLWAV